MGNMKLEERPTPLTDANAYDINESSYEKSADGIWVKADFARRLEQLLSAMAEALNDPYAPSFCNCKLCCIRKEALRHYEELKGQSK